MSLSKRIIILTVTLFLFLMLPCLAKTSSQQEEKKTELEEQVSEELRKQTEDETSSAELKFVDEADPRLYKEADPRFKVEEIRISGNTLISTAKLLTQIEQEDWNYFDYEIDPLTGKPKKDPNGVKIVKGIYNFRVLRDIFENPGKGYEVSITAIQGFTNSILSVYRNEGYAGIYVYVPKNAVIIIIL